MYFRFNTPDFLFYLSKRLNIKGKVADLEFSMDKVWIKPFYWFHVSVMSEVCYFHFYTWPFCLVMFRYDNLCKKT